MFKKTEESEWTRFSRALGGREQAREPDEPALPADDEPDAGPTMVSPPAPVEPEPEPVPLAPARPVLPEPELAAEHQPRAPVSTMVEPARPLADSSRPMADSSRPVAWASAADDAESVIGHGSTVDGSFRSEHSIRILGNAQGEIESNRRVVVEAGAQVSAKITAQQITVSGEVTGELTCPGRVEITPEGRVTGEIQAGSLVMQEGAYFEGHLKMLTKAASANGDTGRIDVGAGV